MKARISAIARHRIGVDGEGVTTLVAFMLCPLRCRYCLNPQTLSERYPHKEYSPEELYGVVRKDELYFLATGGGITFGGGEPLLWVPFIKEFRRICGEGWKINIETSLNVPGDVLRSVTDVVDNYIIDIKDINPDIYLRYTGCENAKVIQNLRYLSENGLAPRCLIRIPEIPGYNVAGDIAGSVAYVRGLGYERLDLFKYNTVKNGERKRNLQDAQGDPPEDRQGE